MNERGIFTGEAIHLLGNYYEDQGGAKNWMAKEESVAKVETKEDF